jgi:hypothetical protein
VVEIILTISLAQPPQELVQRVQQRRNYSENPVVFALLAKQLFLQPMKGPFVLKGSQTRYCFFSRVGQALVGVFEPLRFYEALLAFSSLVLTVRCIP